MSDDAEKQNIEIIPESKENKKKIEVTDTTENIDIDIKEGMQNLKKLSKKHAMVLIPLAFILISMFFAIHLRMQSMDLPITDAWATNTVNNYYKSQIQTQVDADYGDLDSTTKSSVVTKQFNEYLDKNRDTIDSQIKETSNRYKEDFQRDDGLTYLLDLDTYTFYANANNYVKNGHFGTYLNEDGVPSTTRNAPLGLPASKGTFHEYFLVFLYKIFNIFSEMDMMHSMFYFILILAPLTVIPAFFIGKRISDNNIGGFVASFLVAVHQGIVTRTPGGGGDTDIYNVIFPLYIIWMFVETIKSRDLKKKLIFASLTSVFSAIYSFAWSGWWYVYDVVLATLVAIMIVEVIKLYFSKNQEKSKLDMVTIYQKIKPEFYCLLITILLTFVLSLSIYSFATGAVDQGYSKYMQAFEGPLGFIRLKAVGVTNYWPNIMTTVAELNPSSVGDIISKFGGYPYFIIALIGVIALLYKDYDNLMKRNYDKSHHYQFSILLVMWIAATMYPAIKAVRFLMVVTPPLIISFSIVFGMLDNWMMGFYASAKKKLRVRAVLLLVIALLLNPLYQAGLAASEQQLPLMNDMWYDSLTYVNENTAQDAILTSWWDYGYFFTAIAERPVTFDGGFQVPHDAYWVGKSFLTNDENTTIGILRMLDCGQNSAFDALNDYLNDTPKSVKIINEIIVLEKEYARQHLLNLDIPKQVVDDVVKYTHCDAPTSIYITSNDMIKKSGVWGHFGSWNFDRAYMYNQVYNLPKDEAISKLITDFNNTAPEANQLYKSMMEDGGDKFISSYPSYIWTNMQCNDKSTYYECPFTIDEGKSYHILKVPKDDFDAYYEASDSSKALYPDKVVYFDGESIEVIDNTQNNRTDLFGFSAIVIPNQDRSSYTLQLAQNDQADSMFTKLFFFNGEGTSCFDRFYEQSTVTGDKAILWEVDWNCNQDITYYESISKVRARHILIAIDDNKTDEEAYNKTLDIYGRVNDENFEFFAQAYSDCPSADQGGDLGWFGKGQMVKSFEDTVFAMDVGDINITKTNYGYHIVELVDRVDE